MSKLYLFGSYIFACGEITYRMCNDKKMFHCTTPKSTIYTLSYITFAPLVLPFHALNVAVKEFID